MTKFEIRNSRQTRKNIRETVKTVEQGWGRSITPLKRGVNENGNWLCKTGRLCIFEFFH
jgi:hypothetical protein